MEEQADYITDALEMIGITEPKKIITEISGWIPIFEVVLRHYKDHMTALVFGRMWQYCGMEDNVCRASLARIGKDLEISTATVMRHAEKLVNDGYLIDKTPNLRNKPHTYMDGRKVEMKSSLNASVSQRNTTISERNTTVSESQLIKQDNTKIKQEKIKTCAEKPATPNEVKIYREVTGKYPNRATYPNVLKILESVSARLGRPCTSDDLRPFYAEWTFRGFNPINMNWTSWAVTGIIPPAQGRKQQKENNALENYIARLEAAQ